MRQAVVLHAALHASKPVAKVAMAVVAAVVVVVIASAKHARCTPPPARVVEMRPKSHSSLAMTGPFIVATVTNHKVLAAQIPADLHRAGKPRQFH
jgi:hypothetical protein